MKRFDVGEVIAMVKVLPSVLVAIGSVKSSLVL